MDDAPIPLSQFEYELPPELIAQAPAEPRDQSRLLVLPTEGAPPTCLLHRQFADLAELLAPGDVLVVNATKVIPARLRTQRKTGGKVELLFVRPEGDLPTTSTFFAMARPAKGLFPGKELWLEGGDFGKPAILVADGRDGDLVRIRRLDGGSLLALMQEAGEVPLPPYIERPQGPTRDDESRYQTVFARQSGAVAAPTASLHFTPELLARLRQRGIVIAEVVLHVGPGTFLPVRPEHAADVRQHPMHPEWYDIPAATLAAIEARRGKLVAVGTTVARALETYGQTGKTEGESRLFITPGFRFRFVERLVTNFHLPRSTLLMLVSALAGRERVLASYAEAVAQRYRFFSYGDAMLIDRRDPHTSHS